MKLELNVGIYDNFGTIFLVCIGYVYRTNTMHRFLCFKSKFPHHFAFTLGHYLFLLILVQFN